MVDFDAAKALPDADLFKDPQDVYKDIAAGVEQLDCISNLESLSRKCEERMKVIALRIFGDEIICDVTTLDQIWNLPGDYISGPDKPYKFHFIEHFLGRKVHFHIGEGVIEKLPGTKDGPDAKFGIRVGIPCICGKETRIVWARSGLHTGAFCYVYDENCVFVADMRDQCLTCDDCGPKVKAQLEAIDAGYK